jgi:hypothetical protein
LFVCKLAHSVRFIEKLTFFVDMRKNTMLLLLGIFAFLPLGIFAQKVDERLLNALTPLNIKYQTEGSTIFFKQPIGKRTQVVYIDNNTDIFDKFEVRQVYSTVHESSKPLDQTRLQKLLIANGKKKIGAFEMVEKEGAYFVIFTAKVSPTLDATDLKSVIDMVATVADSTEESMFYTDEW